MQCGLNEGQDPPPEQVGLLDIKRTKEKKSMQLVCLSSLLPGECMFAAAAAAASFFDFRLQLLWVQL